MIMSIFSTPLTEVSRKSRRNLLIASAVGYLIALMGLIPTKMESLGIEFTQQNQNSFLIIVLGLIVYSGISFVIYAGIDFSIWHIALKKEKETINVEASKALVRNAGYMRGIPLNEMASEDHQRKIDREVQKEVEMILMNVVSKYKFLGYIRVGWDVFMPVLVGLSAIIVLVNKIIRLP